ncbi:MAG: trypsin-like peptidase domain-containing protein [Chromatiales bacterium]|nr:MAG: trypsin-like peptidase domain-containing protein [Chromatiales bacterium]
MIRSRTWLLCCLLCLPFSPAMGEDAAGLFAKFKDRIFQIRVVDQEAEEKSALGTGFLVAYDGLIATNYHVIADFADKPDKYRLEYEDQQGNKGQLRLLDVDVINDLALLSATALGREPLQISSDEPAQGETIYSIGNPYDIGFTVVPGTYNGIAEDSYYKRIHFSGSINAGMSGGPVLNATGHVVGINVSTAGNQISFLVPVTALRELIGTRAAADAPVADVSVRIREQLLANQRGLIDGLLAVEWPTQELGQAVAVDEMAPFVKCWGGSTDDKQLYSTISSSCSSEDDVYVGPGLSTGVVAYQFFWLDAGDLSAPRFQSYYRNLFADFMPDNGADEDNVTNFACDEMFVEQAPGLVNKVVLCLRAYRKFSGLYDALYVSGSVDWRNRAFISHFTLAGVEPESLTTFMERFQQVVQR